MWSSRVWKAAAGAGSLAAAPFLMQRKDDPPVPPPPEPSLGEAIAKAHRLTAVFKERCGAPGLSVGVAYRGRTLWHSGLGFADVENATPMQPQSVVRIASISKSISALLAISLTEQGKLDLQKNVRDYVPEFPVKKVNGQVVNVTVTHVLSHTSGIRHYVKTKKKEDDSKVQENHREFEAKEYYIKEHFGSVLDSLSLFREDPLLHAPGVEFTYTTHGYTLLSAVLERAAGEPFERQLRRLLARLEMWDTYMEDNDTLTACRARHYVRNKKGQLSNVPYVDNSYKWAGGGLVSNVPDLLRFANHLLSISSDNAPLGARLVSRELLERAWSPVAHTNCNWFGRGIEGSYGLGWCLARNSRGHRYVLHTGAAIGASTVLLLVPEAHLAVVVLCNLQDASGIGFLGKRIADEFLEALEAPSDRC